MTDDEMNDWGMDFLDEMESDLKDNHNDDGLFDAWQAGDYETIMDWIEEEYSDLDEEQIEWIKTALDVE